MSGPSNLTNTTVCDACHSPDGAYDGVDDPNIGARNNWVFRPPPSSLIFNGSGDFQTGKEKWCVGCHDGVPSVINSVSAPNIAGESNSDCTAAGVPYSCCTGLDTGTCVDYGYYHTGHGKYVSESITCLACHDPDSEHVVDGVARTYSAASDNYQAGYRLKLVGGQAPLEIPRPLTAVTADQFRQCFSCHNSAPFMNSDNYNTNFRADVDDTLRCSGSAVEQALGAFEYRQIANMTPTLTEDQLIPLRAVRPVIMFTVRGLGLERYQCSWP